MKIQLKDLNELKHLVNIEPSQSILDLRKAIEVIDPLKYPLEKLKLIYNNSMLNDSESIQDINYASNRFIIIVANLTSQTAQDQERLDQILIEKMARIGISKTEYKKLKEHVLNTSDLNTYVYFDKAKMQIEIPTDEMKEIINGDVTLFQSFVDYIINLPQVKPNITNAEYDSLTSPCANRPNLPITKHAPSNTPEFSALELSHMKEIMDRMGYDEQTVKSTFLSYNRNTQATIEYLMLLSEQTNQFSEEDMENLVELSLLGYEYEEVEEAYVICNSDFQATIEFLCDFK